MTKPKKSHLAKASKIENLVSLAWSTNVASRGGDYPIHCISELLMPRSNLHNLHTLINTKRQINATGDRRKLSTLSGRLLNSHKK